MVESTGEPKHVVVIGGGFGGLTTARRLAGGPVRVTLIDRENHHLFQPLLYQVATAGLSPHEIATPIRSVFRGHSNVRVLLGAVTRVEPDARRVVLEDGDTVSYDYLVVAAGAKTNYFGHDEWAAHAHGLKSVRDAIRIRERILMMFEAAEREPDVQRRRRLLTFVVIGGGPTGVEMAGAISELGRRVLARDYRTVHADEVRVLLLEMADRVLLPFDPTLSARARAQLEALGVEVWTGARVDQVSPEGVAVGDRFVPASVVCWAPGVKPVSLGERTGLPLDARGRIHVDASCAVPGRPEVFAIGDMARFVPEGDEQPLPQLAPVAMQQGRHVAATIQRDRAGKPRRTFRYRDKGIMATIGRSRAVAESGRVRVSGLVAWLMWLVVHLAFLIGFRNRLFVLLEWMWSYLAFRRGARLVVARYELPAEGQPDRDPFSVQLPGFLLEGGPRSRAEQAGEEERTGEQPAAVARTPELPR